VRVRFATSELERLYEDASFVAPGFGRDVVRAYRKKVGFLLAAGTEQELLATGRSGSRSCAVTVSANTRSGSMTSGASSCPSKRTTRAESSS